MREAAKKVLALSSVFASLSKGKKNHSNDNDNDNDNDNGNENDNDNDSDSDTENDHENSQDGSVGSVDQGEDRSGSLTQPREEDNGEPQTETEGEAA